MTKMHLPVWRYDQSVMYTKHTITPFFPTDVFGHKTKQMSQWLLLLLPEFLKTKKGLLLSAMQTAQCHNSCKHSLHNNVLFTKVTGNHVYASFRLSEILSYARTHSRQSTCTTLYGLLKKGCPIIEWLPESKSINVSHAILLVYKRHKQKWPTTHTCIHKAGYGEILCEYSQKKITRSST